MLSFKDRGHRVGCKVKGQIHFESKFSSFCNLFLLLSLPFSAATIQLKLRLNWQQLSKRLAAWWSSGALSWHLSGLVYAQGSARALTPRTHSLRRYHESVPQTEIKMWKAMRLKAFLAPHGILFSLWQSLWDWFFFHVSFFPFRLFNNMRTELSRRDMLDRQSKGVLVNMGLNSIFCMFSTLVSSQLLPRLDVFWWINYPL